MDRFRTIDSFVRIANAGSFPAAAKQLGLSRALVSLHINDLEKRLGVRLLNRTTRSLTLTDAGTTYLEFCQRLLAEMSQQEASIAQRQKEPRGLLKVAAPKSFGTLHLSDAVVSFAARGADPGTGSRLRGLSRALVRQARRDEPEQEASRVAPH
jgi:DNA-binding transcriptional LysR family regulator